ncbi:MAG: SgcJ/EcaC family oxidoreductase [Hyphomonas sp.]|tara:strand:- start:4654 stop:4995 length:342 start_codon:yes stop_codon:yes gene_type:complete
MSSSSDIIQRQLDAYNSQDIEAFLACYAEDALLSGLNGDVTQSGRAAIRARHVELFGEHPQNRAELVNRIDIGSTVIDHERVARTPGGETFDVAAIYTIRNGLIARVDFARGS